MRFHPKFLAFQVILVCSMGTMAVSWAKGQSIQRLPPTEERETIAPGVSNPAPVTPITPSKPPITTPDALTPWSPDELFAPTWYQPAYWFGPKPWETSIEVGMNGSDGTSKSFSMRAGGSIKRKTDWNKLDVSLIYNETSSGGVQSQNNAQMDARHDWLLGESPWTVFLATSLLYDEFQAFDLRWAANAGIGYQFIETETSNLIGRFGAGTSREFGGPDDRWVPEALFGLEYDFKITGCQKFYAKSDYFPDWENFDSFRLVTDIGWELLLDAESNLNLKISVIDRYDSTPNGAEPNLLNYSILLLWKL